MPDHRERLDQRAHVKGSMVTSHLAWAAEVIPDSHAVLTGILAPEHRQVVERSVLDSTWVPLASVVALDRAIAKAVGGDPVAVFEALGRSSARQNLVGVYRSFQSRDPHQFFRNSAMLHDRYQDFGSAHYDIVGEREGRFSILDASTFSPVHCAGERGYLAEALIVLGATEAPVVAEVACRCAGDDSCVFDVAW